MARVGLSIIAALAVALSVSTLTAQTTRKAPTKADKDKGDKALARMMKYAPPDAIGAFHIEIASIRKGIKATLAKNKQAAEALAPYLDILDAVSAAESADFILLQAPDGLSPMLALHGPLTKKDVQKAIKMLAGVDGKLTTKGDGKYTVEDSLIRIVIGSESPVLKENVVLMGYGGVLSTDSLKAMGKSVNGPLMAMIKKTDTSADAWGGMNMDVDKNDPTRPIRITGCANLAKGGSFNVDITLATAETAKRFVEDLGTNATLSALVKCSQKGSVVSMTGAKDKNLLAGAIKALATSRKRAKKTLSTTILKHIAVSIEFYRGLNDGEGPPSLAALVEETGLPAKVLISPMSGRTIETDAKGIPTGKIDYVYIALPKNAPGGLITVYEKPEFYDNRGANVLYADGSVGWLDIKSFQTALTKTKKWLATKNPK